MTDINPTVPTRPRTVVDLFCGAGGASEGVAQACEELGMERPALIAVNHWSVAVETHRRNHPWAQHYCARVESIDPRAAVGGPVGWVLDNVRPLTTPVACKGTQGLWAVPPDVEAAVRAQIGWEA